MKKLSIILGTLILIFVSYFIVNQLNEKNQTVNDNQNNDIIIDNEDNIDKEIKTFIETKYKEGNITDDNDNILIKYEIFYPAVSHDATEAFKVNVSNYYDNINNKIEEYFMYEGYDNAFDRFQKEKENFFENIYRTDIDVQYEDKNYICIHRVVEEYTGGNTQSVKNYSETFNKKDGTLILLSDIVSNTNKLTEMLVKNKAKYQALDYNFYDDVDMLLIEKFDTNNFYFDGHYLYIYYNTYDIAPATEDSPYFIIPHKDIVNLYKEEYKYLGE